MHSPGDEQTGYQSTIAHLAILQLHRVSLRIYTTTIILFDTHCYCWGPVLKNLLRPDRKSSDSIKSRLFGHVAFSRLGVN